MFLKINTNPNLNISCIKDDFIYHVEEQTIYKRCIYDFNNHQPLDIKIEEEIEDLFFIENYFIIGCKTTIYTFINTKLINREVFSSPLLLKKRYKNSLLCLTDNNKIYILEPPKTKSIVVYNPKNIIIKDISVTEDATHLLSGDGLVFKNKNVCLTATLTVHKPLKIIPEPLEVPIGIYSNSYNRVVLAYTTGIEVYNTQGDILYLLYRYNTKYYKLVEGDNLYCIDGTLNLIGDYLRVVYNGVVKTILNNICITRDYLYIIPPEEEGIITQLEGLSLSSSGVEKKLLTTFCNLRSEFTIKQDGDSQKAFDKLVLEKYREFYRELKSINDTLVEKKVKLDRLEGVIRDKAITVGDRRERLVTRFKRAIDKYNKGLEKVKINGKEILTLIGAIKQKLELKKNNLKYKTELETQRNLLIEKLQGN